MGELCLMSPPSRDTAAQLEHWVFCGFKVGSVVQGVGSEEGREAQVRQKMRKRQWDCRIETKTKLSTTYSYYCCYNSDATAKQNQPH